SASLPSLGKSRYSCNAADRLGERNVPPPLPDPDFDRLTVEQRLDLIGRLWDSIPDEVSASAMPESHRQELERRLAAADAAPEQGIPWEQVKARLRGQP